MSYDLGINFIISRISSSNQNPKKYKSMDLVLKIYCLNDFFNFQERKDYAWLRI